MGLSGGPQWTVMPTIVRVLGSFSFFAHHPRYGFHSSDITLGKLLYLSEAQFLHLKNRTNNSIYFMRLMSD